MKLSTKSSYGLRILVQIALDNAEGRLSCGRRISEKQNIPEPYLEQIMIPLKTAKIVKAVRGCNGGYKLNRSPESISVLELIELFEGEVKMVNSSYPQDKSTDNSISAAAGMWRHLAGIFRNYASQISLGDVVKNRFSDELA